MVNWMIVVFLIDVRQGLTALRYLLFGLGRICRHADMEERISLIHESVVRPAYDDALLGGLNADLITRERVGYESKLVTFGDGRVNVAKDEEMTIPLTPQGAQHPTLDYVISVTQFPYLPNLAG